MDGNTERASTSRATRIVVVGYGNVGRGVLRAAERNGDVEVAVILSRSPERARSEVEHIPVRPLDDVDALREADVAVLCGGSKNDLPVQGPEFAALTHTVDSYDNHSEVMAYCSRMDEVAKEAGTVALISTGWDPGTFSMERVLANAFLPGTATYGFYGQSQRGGLSMGHSDAIRTLEGVRDARQYTHAIPEAIEAVRAGENPDLSPGEMHWRECFVVAEDGADRDAIAEGIKTMPGYFAPYRTEVHFVTQEELDARHSGFPHDGLVIACGTTGDGNRALIEYRSAWDSNPEATASILVAHARAVHRLAGEGRSGAFTIYDVPPAYLSPHSREHLIEHFL